MLILKHFFHIIICSKYAEQCPKIVHRTLQSSLVRTFVLHKEVGSLNHGRKRPKSFKEVMVFALFKTQQQV